MRACAIKARGGEKRRRDSPLQHGLGLAPCVCASCSPIGCQLWKYSRLRSLANRRGRGIKDGAWWLAEGTDNLRRVGAYLHTHKKLKQRCELKKRFDYKNEKITPLSISSKCNNNNNICITLTKAEAQQHEKKLTGLPPTYCERIGERH